jgi:hypothetical protein
MQNETITAYNALQPSMVRTIREVFDDAVSEIERRRGQNAPPLPDCVRAEVARKIVDLAKHGECDIERLRLAGISAVPG